jgi:hypothetical protein
MSTECRTLCEAAVGGDFPSQPPETSMVIQLSVRAVCLVFLLNQVGGNPVIGLDTDVTLIHRVKITLVTLHFDALSRGRQGRTAASPEAKRAIVTC